MRRLRTRLRLRWLRARLWRRGTRRRLGLRRRMECRLRVRLLRCRTWCRCSLRSSLRRRMERRLRALLLTRRRLRLRMRRRASRRCRLMSHFLLRARRKCRMRGMRRGSLVWLLMHNVRMLCLRCHRCCTRLGCGMGCRRWISGTREVRRGHRLRRSLIVIGDVISHVAVELVTTVVDVVRNVVGVLAVIDVAVVGDVVIAIDHRRRTRHIGLVVVDNRRMISTVAALTAVVSTTTATATATPVHTPRMPTSTTVVIQ